MADETLDGYLEQAGCDMELRACVARLDRRGRASEALPRLSAHRMRLLEESHAACRRLDCIDHAIHLITCER